MNNCAEDNKITHKEPIVMTFTNNAYHDIINTIGNRKAESGGLLFGYLDDYVIREFVFDENACTSGASYTFDVDFLNEKIKELWEERELACIGFIHSHPWGFKVPSGADMNYFRNSKKWMPREKLMVPIVSTITGGGFNLNPCILFKKDKEITIADKIEIIVEEHKSKYSHICNPPRIFKKDNELLTSDEMDDIKSCNQIEGEFYYNEPYYPQYNYQKQTGFTIRSLISDIFNGLFKD